MDVPSFVAFLLTLAVALLVWRHMLCFFLFLPHYLHYSDLVRLSSVALPQCILQCRTPHDVLVGRSRLGCYGSSESDGG